MKRFVLIFLVASIILPVALIGCKSKAEKAEPQEGAETMPEGEIMLDALPVQEPSQLAGSETIPPTAALPAEGAISPVAQESLMRAKDIQTALKKAGYYAGAIDGKIGPKTKQAIMDFQKAKGLKIDGKVGPKTWAELEKYLVRR